MRTRSKKTRDGRTHAGAFCGGLLIVACSVAGAPALAAPADPAGKLAGRDPVRLEIASVGIDAPIEPIDVTRSGQLGSTTSDMAVGWFRHGFRPGESGNTILVGHVMQHRSSGHGGLWRLDEVETGDAIIVTTRGGSRLRFVASAAEEPDSNFTGIDIDRIFGQARTQNLNIMSHGVPDELGRGEAGRVVVFSSRSEAYWPSRGIRGQGASHD